MEKKHILVISQYFYPEQFRINDICQEWINRGYKITVITGIPNYPQGKFYDGYGFFRRNRERWKGIEIIRIPLVPRGQNAIKLVLNYLSFVVSGYFWNLFTSTKADMVFIFEVSPMTQALVGTMYAKKHKVPCDIYVQDLWPENVQIVTGIHNKSIIAAIDKMVRYIYNSCRNIYTTSESFADSVKVKTNNPRTTIIYWPQYAEVFYQPVEAAVQEKEEFVIGFTGNIGKAQGLEILVETAQILKSKEVCVKFIIIGEGRNRQMLENEIARKGLESYFQFKGRIPAQEIPKALGNCDVAFVSFMNNRLFEKTIPAKLQSYMACAKPILSSANGETRKIVEEAECGFNCEIGDSAALADKILALKDMDKAALEQMGKNGLIYCRKNFDKKFLMDCLEEYISME